MSDGVEQTTGVVQRLIESCQEARQGFSLAAEATEDFTLKRLFNIYAQQRSRFAEELRECGGYERNHGDAASQLREWSLSARDNDRELLECCLAADEQTLQLYREAMRKHIPRKAHFLISAQLSLMERVHERMHGLLREQYKPHGRVNVTMERAVI